MEITADQSLCIIQISRIGDILQTLNAVRSLRYYHPQIKLTLVARRRYAEPILFLIKPLFDHIFLMDLSQANETNLVHLKKHLHSFVEDINSIPFDHCYNLTFSQSSAYLTSLIKASHKKGMVRNNKGELLIPDSWGQLVYGVVMRGPHCPFNLVDIFKAIFGLPLEQTPLPHHPMPQRPHIVIHPFASQEKKYWPSQKWEEVIYNLLQQNRQLEISIMGSPEESVKIKQLLTPRLTLFADRLHDLSQTSCLESFYQSLDEVTLFVGHDSMGGHLAALKGVPTLTLSLGTVRPQETTPYGQNDLNIIPNIPCFPCTLESNCEEHACHKAISTQLVTTLIEYTLEQKVPSYENLMQDIPFLHLTTVDICQSDLSEGSLRLHSLSGHYPSLGAVFRDYYYVLLNYILEQRDVKASLPQIAQKIVPELTHYLDGLKKCYELSRFAQESCHKMLEQLTGTAPNQKLIQEQLQKVQEIDTLYTMLLKPYPLLAPLIDYFYVGRANLKGEKILQLTTQLLLNYQEMFCAFQILQEFIQKSLQESCMEIPKKEELQNTPSQHDN